VREAVLSECLLGGDPRLRAESRIGMQAKLIKELTLKNIPVSP
jgi:hypothetical protein